MTYKGLTALAVGCAITLAGATDSNASITTETDSAAIRRPDGEQLLDEDTVMWVDPPSTTVNIGDTFTIYVAITTIPETRGAQNGFQGDGVTTFFGFDPSILYCNSVTEGTFYSDWASAHGGSTFFISGSIDNTTGNISVSGVAILGGSAGGPSGTGDYLNLNCTAISTGTTAIALTGAGPAGSVVASTSGTSLPLTVYNGAVTVL